MPKRGPSVWTAHRRERRGSGSVSRAILLLIACVVPLASLGATPLRVLILSGQNNHDWSATTPVLRKILERQERFVVDVTEHPEACTADTFARYDILLSNWNGWGQGAVTNWPSATRAAFLDFIRRGRGLVVVHAGSSSFYDWPEYQEVTGGSWDLERTGHGAVHEFEVRIADPGHPITRGLGAFRTTDELWHRTGFQPGVHVLATAFSNTEQGGSGAQEPVAVTTRFGKGRTFFLVLGHDVAAMRSPGFETLLVRGTEWVAAGVVGEKGSEP